MDTYGVKHANIIKHKSGGSNTSYTSRLGGGYEVFLSFSGDTRKTFSDFLYTCLDDASICTFRDDNEIRVGEEIGPELLNAINESKISIPIFSKNYASSKWCLYELSQMVHCYNTKGQKIFPIYYDVEPFVVRHQLGSYEEAFRQHEVNFDARIVQGWKEALVKVTSIEGFELKKETHGREGELTKKVVEKVLLELRNKYVELPEDLVGIDVHVKVMKGLLDIDSDGVRIVGIVGMGGIGKTTIAKVIYNQLCEFFDFCCFLEGVGDMSQQKGQQKGFVYLQSHFRSKILKVEGHKIYNDDNEMDKIRNAVNDKKVLIVLDDVNEKSKFDNLPQYCNWFGSGSRIIITTRYKDIFNQLIMSYQNDGLREVSRSYESQLMNMDDSLELFSKYAFHRDFPPQSYDILSKEFVIIGAGLPLSLVTIGLLLFGKEKTLWEETLRKLKKVPIVEVHEKLRISFDALDYEQKQIFLDIACLFVGEDIRNPFYMWKDCGFYPRKNIDILILRYMIEVGDDNRIWMHDQVRELGRQIVREENLNEPGDRSRLWHPEDALDILESHTGTKKVVALCLDIEREHPEDPPFCIAGECFENLRNLRYLSVGNADLAGNFKYLLPNLRWLQCKGNFSLTNFHLKNLVVLHLSNSDITNDWEGWSQIQMATKLKVLNLSRCGRLRNILQISTFKSLESLGLQMCQGLRMLDVIEHLKSLRYLNASRCEILESLTGLSKLEKLKCLEISGCDKLFEIEGLDKLESLELLDMTGCTSIKRLPDLSNLRILKELILCRCMNLREVEGLMVLESLEILDMLGCVSVERMLDLSNLKNLKKLRFGGLYYLSWIQGFEELKSLEFLEIVGCKSIEKLPNLSGLKKLKEISVYGCLKLTAIPGLKGLNSLKSLDICECKSIVKLPNLSGLKNLKEIRVSVCVKLAEIPGLEGLNSLELLDIFGCQSIKMLPNLSRLKNLKEIRVSWCVKLTEIPKLEGLNSLESFDIRGCKSIEKLPNLSGLKNLKEIRVSCCLKLTEILGLEGLNSLKSVDIHGCELLENVPFFAKYKHKED